MICDNAKENEPIFQITASIVVMDCQLILGKVQTVNFSKRRHGIAFALKFQILDPECAG